MKIYKSIEAFKKVNNSIVTIGTFDGVHLGHKVIIDRLKKMAQDVHGETVLLTFFPHPRIVLYPENNELRMLNTINERIQMIENAGIDHLIVHPFSKEFSRISSVDFIRDVICNSIGASRLIIGYDHHFGRNREGTLEHLQELAPLYDFEVEEIPAQEIQQINISSTKIRNALIDGEVDLAAKFLGYNYSINGTVVKGNQLGREIGFPTANIKVDEWYKLIPKQGVYAVRIIIDNKEYGGMLNIGTRPTLNGKTQTIEVNIFDFNEDIYEQEIKLSFLKRIRHEQDFSELDLLKKQIATDKEEIIQLFNEL